MPEQLQERRIAMKRIVVVRRNDDYHASLEGHPEIWGCGKTSESAIGSLVSAHKEVFDIVEIKYSGPDSGK